MLPRELIIEGARQNNLKNIYLRLPHNKVIAITGVSGSGKSSLAFDTIFAEGQWRFIESLSTYARLFLEKLDRPDVEAISNIRPAIALEQRNPVKGSRSTVGTLTELYDLLRVLYSRAATPFCPKCGNEIRKWDPSQITFELLQNYLNEKAVIIFEACESVESLKQRGFHRIYLDGEFIDLADAPARLPERLDVVLDRLVIRDEPRLSDSLEVAWREGGERLKVIIVKAQSSEHGIQNSSGCASSLDADTQRLTINSRPTATQSSQILRFSSKNTCDECGISIPEPTPILFSFNHPVCACPECKGFGNILVYDEDLILRDKRLSLAAGVIDLWEKPGYRWWKDQMLQGAKRAGIDTKKSYEDLTQEEKNLLWQGDKHFYGIRDFFEEMEGKRYKLHIRVLLSRYRSPVICPKCNGRRLCDSALAYKIEGLDIAELTNMPISRLLPWFNSLQLSPMQWEIAKEALNQILMKLKFLERVGLGYISLSRQAKSLSGGEYQRVNLSNQLGSALTGTLYVLDEPTIGLHARDTRRIAKIMRELSSRGNTVIVVEHDREIIASSDWVVELGPGGGHSGGKVMFSGEIKDFLESDTLTAHHLSHNQVKGLFSIRRLSPFPSHWLVLHGATGNSLKKVKVSVPIGCLTVVSGVSGSGKSSLIVETLYPILGRHFKMTSQQSLPYNEIEGVSYLKGVRLIDQSPIGKTPRSNPVTYLKIFEPIRKIFSRQPESKVHGYAPGFFSFNISGGRCETCKGEGYQRMEMYFFEDIFVKCEDCKGKRYKAEVLNVTYKGKNVSDVLDMTIDEAVEFFHEVSEITSKLHLMKDIGLGYLRLGQPATTLSGGEAQRLKICAELFTSPSSFRNKKERGGLSKGLLYVLDEPTIGLHHQDVVMFMKVIRKLVDAGNTVIIIEHNLDVIGGADWVVDMGPEGGEEGGTIIFEGPPEELTEAATSYTGKYLNEYWHLTSHDQT
ncbi:MAG: excinuclease ABC subunit UvrA [Dissulfurispiraceae bacterium]